MLVRVCLWAGLAVAGLPTSTCDSQYQERTYASGRNQRLELPPVRDVHFDECARLARLVIRLCDNSLALVATALIIPRPGAHRGMCTCSRRSPAPVQDFLGWVLNAPPEFRESKFTAQNDDREVTRVQSVGWSSGAECGHKEF